MKLAISGTYSSGKTITVMALSHYTGYPHTLAQSIREILPDAVPGKRLADVTPAEFLQLMMRRHAGRAVHERLLGDRFLSDGSSLQEWIYGAARVEHGMNPNETVQRQSRAGENPAGFLGSEEHQFFADVVTQYGYAFRQHVKSTFDAFVHLRNELPIASDGHRPMNERFRATCDAMMLATVQDLQIQHHVIGGSLFERLDTIVDLFGFDRLTSIDEAVEHAQQRHSRLDMRSETERARSSVAV